MKNMKIDKKRMTQLKKYVDDYIKSLDTEEEAYKLKNTPQELIKFVKYMKKHDLMEEEIIYTKLYFKEQLPYKEWRERISKSKGLLSQEIEDFQELIDPNYERKTPRGRM